MGFYRKKPVTVEAIQWTGKNTEEILKWCKDAELEVQTEAINNVSYTYINLYINTLEGRMTASEGDYIVKGVNGEYYPCKPDIFEKTYEEA